MTDITSIYHLLPFSLKVIAASIWGYRLRKLRYNFKTESLVDQAFEREAWNKNQWENWYEEQLTQILHRAATQVPFYRNFWQLQRRHQNKKSWEYLENWPILEKDEVRNNPESFVADDKNIRKLYIDHTSGTTGRPTYIYESKETIVNWYSIFETRVRRWHNVTYKNRWGIFGGKRIIPLSQKTPPYWLINYGLNQIYFSIFHITKASASKYVEALNKFAPTHLIVYPSSLSVLAKYILDQKLEPHHIKVIFSNSEKVLEHQKSIIQKAFNCPIIDTYGMAELLSGASECIVGTMHYWPEIGYLEVYDSQKSEYIHNSRHYGEYIFTSLINKDMPLIRYKNGDVGYLPRWEFSCDCGKRLPKFEPIQGRSNDLIITPDGRQIYLLDSLFNGLSIIEAQLIQESIDRIIIKLVPEKTYNRESVVNDIRKRLQDYLGNIQVDINEVDSIPREVNGKFRPYISLVKK